MADHTDPAVNRRWAGWRERVDLDEYETRFDAMAQAGKSAHGEADAVSRLLPEGGSVLDAGCGMGRIAMELVDRGYDVVGTDVDPEMLERAHRRRPGCAWVHGDLVSEQFGQAFDLILLAGNVMIFVPETTEAAIIANLGAQLTDEGLLVAGFGLGGSPVPGITLSEYDTFAAAENLALVDRWATWEGDPYRGADYAVSIHAPTMAES